MKILPVFLGISLVAVLSSCVGDSGSVLSKRSSSNYIPIDIDMKVVQVSAHTYFVQGANGIAVDNSGFVSNAGIIITSEGIILFDALGTPALAARLLRKIREISDKPIKAVVMSHYHADHLYGLQVFKEQGARIYAPDGANDYLNSDAAESLLVARRKLLAPWVNEDTKLVVPDLYVNKNIELTFGDITLKWPHQGSS